jgi:hypothetical protein
MERHFEAAAPIGGKFLQDLYLKYSIGAHAQVTAAGVIIFGGVFARL